MNYQELVEANKLIKNIDVKGKEYAQVNERIKVFRYLYPEGTIQTELLSNAPGEDGKYMCVIKAYALNAEGRVLASGHAYEKEGSSFINATSYLENAETSAIGRCLGTLGIGIDTSVASAEEVQNAMLNQKPKNTVTFGNITNASWKELNKFYEKDEIKAMYEECGVTNGKDLKEEYAQKKIEEARKKFVEDLTNKSNDGKQFY